MFYITGAQGLFILMEASPFNPKKKKKKKVCRIDLNTRESKFALHQRPRH